MRAFQLDRSGIHPNGQDLRELFPHRVDDVRELERVAANHGVTPHKRVLLDVDRWAAWHGCSFTSAAHAVCRQIRKDMDR